MKSVRTPSRALKRRIFVLFAALVAVGGFAYWRSSIPVEPEVLAFEEDAPEVPDQVFLPSDAAAAASAMAADLDLEGTCGTEGSYCIGVVTGIGRVDDGGLNEVVWNSTLEYATSTVGDGPRVQVDLVETSRLDDLAGNIKILADEKYDLIVTIGSEAADATNDAAQAYPESDFFGIDQQGDSSVANYFAATGSEVAAASSAVALAAEASSTGTVGLVLPTANNESYDLFLAGATEAARQAGVTLVDVRQPTLRSGPAATWAPALIGNLVDDGADVVVVLGVADAAGVLDVVGTFDGLLCVGHGADRWTSASTAKTCLITSVVPEFSDPLIKAISTLRSGKSLPSPLVANLGFAEFRPIGSEDGVADSGQTFPELETLGQELLGD